MNMIRRTWVDQIVPLLDTDLAWTTDRAMNHWWVDSRAHSGLRLTTQARDLAHSVGLPSWRFAIVDQSCISPRMMLLLNGKLECPYWLDFKAMVIELFGSREATMVALYGNFDQFAKTLALDCTSKLQK